MSLIFTSIHKIVFNLCHLPPPPLHNLNIEGKIQRWKKCTWPHSSDMTKMEMVLSHILRSPLKFILVIYLLHSLPQGDISKGELRQMLEDLGEGYVCFFSHSLYVYFVNSTRMIHIFVKQRISPLFPALYRTGRHYHER
jgi:hypothetical protein